MRLFALRGSAGSLPLQWPWKESPVAAVVSSVLAVLVIAAALVAGYFVFATRRIAARAEKMVPPSGKFIDIDGNRIHYAEAGKGPAIACGCSIATVSASMPPSEWPTSSGRSSLSCSISLATMRACSLRPALAPAARTE